MADFKDYAVIITTYRGRTSEGKDQFGGDEVNDIPALMYYLPILGKALNIDLMAQMKFMVSTSRVLTCLRF